MGGEKVARGEEVGGIQEVTFVTLPAGSGVRLQSQSEALHANLR